MSRRAGDALELAWHTPRSWAAAVLEEPLELLSDHAHCELGAALSAQGLILRRTSDGFYAQRLAALAQEELAHFRQVLRLLEELGGELRPPVPNPYVEALHRQAAATRVDGLLDRLLCAALIERRSLERFELLAQAARRTPLGALYAELAPSERGHGILFRELALRLFEAPLVERRLAALCALEAGVAAQLAGGPRIHSGPPHAGAAGRAGRGAQGTTAPQPTSVP